jgi:hypothetical protein
MTKRTRLFLVISATVLVVGLGTGLLASYMGNGLQNVTIFGSDGPPEFAYVPQDVGLVAFANVRDVMGSQLRQKLLELRTNTPDNDQNQFQTETGIDIERDIDTVVAALGVGGQNNNRAPLVLARGRFDQGRIESVVQQRGGQVETYNGQQLLTIVEDDHTLALAFVEAGLVAFGGVEDVRRAIDTKRGTSPNVTSNTELMALVRDMDNGNAWAVGRFDTIARDGRLPQQVASQLPPINWFAASGHINGGVEGLVRAEANTEQAAIDLREVIRGFMALARLQTRQNTELTAMLDSLQLGGEGKTVSLAFSVPPEMLDRIVALRRSQPGRVGNTPELPDAPPTPPAPSPVAAGS